MNPRKAKTLITVLSVIVVISLTINLILLGRLHRTTEQAGKWKKAHERLAFRQLLLEKQKENLKTSQTKKNQSFRKKNHRLQSTNVFEHAKRSAESRAESQEYPPEDAEGNNGFFRNNIKDMLTATFKEEYPDLDLNPAEIDELTDVVMTIRGSLQDMRYLERSSENVGTIKDLQERREQAMWDFERITGMSAMEFMLRAPDEGGIDR
jgi:tRNA U34 5-carboxymethylaminomethyl modifying enzyme MnmG/GidA